MEIATHSFGFTFGASELASKWPDRRELSWDALVDIITSHKPGKKEGPCLVPAVFSGISRKKEEAVQIDVAFLDSDTGVPLAEIVTAIKRMGWAAVVSSTHSHLTRRTEVAEKNWDRFFANNRGSTPEDFLREEKGYRPEVARGATSAETIEHLVQIDHGPCPKFRVVIPLAKPWKATDYPSQTMANARWKAAVEALAASLALPHDQSCTDTSRLFFLPRKPPHGAAPEVEVIEGDPCDIFALASPESPDLLNGHASPPKINGHHPSPETFEYTDPRTGEILDLTTWARVHGRTFLIAEALKARRPGALTSHVAGNKIHIECPNSGAHTHPGQDGATFVSNAGHDTTKGFVVHCRHAHCTGKDRLFFVQKMLEERWIEIDDLTAPAFHLEVDIPGWDADDPGPHPDDQPGEPALDWDWGKKNATGIAARWQVPLDIFQTGAEIAPRVAERHIPTRLWPFVEDTATRMGVDPTTVALGAIVTCASVIHDDWRLQPKRHDRTWTESARLWGCIVGDPSTLKSPVVMACTRIIDRMEAESRRQHDDDMDRYEKAHAIWKKLKDTDQPEPRRPKLLRYLVEGATMEALQEVLRDDPKAHQRAVAGKVLCRQDEMSEWAGNLDRYGGGKGGGDRGAYLRLYNGGRFTVDRIARGSFAVSNWSACFLTGCQPEPIQKIARDAAEDGLLQRFIYAVPPSSGDGIDRQEDEAALEEYHAVIRALAAARPLSKENGFGHEHLAFHTHAHVHREAIDKAARAVSMIPDTSNRVKSTLGKWPGLFARLCLTFHLIDHAGTFTPYVIGEETAERVKNYMLEIILPHLFRADATMFLTPQTGHARWIAGHILAHGLENITTREVVRAYRGLRSPEQARDLTATMASLVSVGWLDPTQPRNSLTPVSSWKVNPGVHERFVDQAAREYESRETIRAMIQDNTPWTVPVGFSNDEIQE